MRDSNEYCTSGGVDVSAINSGWANGPQEFECAEVVAYESVQERCALLEDRRIKRESFE